MSNIFNMFKPNVSMESINDAVEPFIHDNWSLHENKNLEASELRRNLGQGALAASIAAIGGYLGMTYLGYYVIPSDTIMPMGNFLFHPINTFHQMASSTEIGTMTKVGAYLKAFAITGAAGLLSKWLWEKSTMITDGYKHLEGKKFFKHTLYSMLVMQEELERLNARRKIAQEDCVSLLGKLMLNFQVLVSNAVVGKPGSGKTVFYKNLISQILKDPDATLIVHDFKGDFTKMLPKEESIILAPWDKRCRELAYCLDLETEQDAIEFWAALIPDPKGGDAIWNQSARAIGVGLTKKLMAEKPQAWSIADLTELLVDAVANIKKAMNTYNRQASRFVSDDEESKMTQGILATLIAETLPLFNLASAYKGKKKRQFSVKEWVTEVINGTLKESEDYKNKRIIILQFNATYPKLSQAYIKSFLNSFISKINNPSIEDNPKRKIHLLLDEFPQIGPVNIEMLLEVARSKGVKIWLAWQTMDQMPKIYGKEGAENIYSNIANYWFMQMSTDSMKTWAEKKCGKRKVKNWKTSESSNAQGQSNSRNLNSELINVVDAHTFEADLGVTSNGVLGIANIADLKGIYRLNFPFKQDYKWSDNKSVVLADWIQNWAKDIQPEDIITEDKVLNEQLSQYMDMYDDFSKDGKKQKIGFAPQESKVVADSASPMVSKAPAVDITNHESLTNHSEESQFVDKESELGSDLLDDILNNN